MDVRIIIGIVAFVVVVLFLPASISSRISSIAVSLGLIFTAYTLYLNNVRNTREVAINEIDRKYDYWSDIFLAFMDNPDLKDFHREIYGNHIPMKKHAIYSIFVQIIGSMVAADDADLLMLDQSWEELIFMWINSPDFYDFWERNRFLYRDRTRLFVEERMLIPLDRLGTMP